MELTIIRAKFKMALFYRATGGSVAQMSEKGQARMSELFLVRLRELQGKESVSAFARHLEMPQTTLNSYVLGRRKPSVELIKRICLKCGVTSDWLIGISDVRGTVQNAAPIPLVTKSRQKVFEQSALLSEELAAIRRELHRQAGELAALKQLNQPSAACCG